MVRNSDIGSYLRYTLQLCNIILLITTEPVFKPVFATSILFPTGNSLMLITLFSAETGNGGMEGLGGRNEVLGIGLVEMDGLVMVAEAVVVDVDG